MIQPSPGFLAALQNRIEQTRPGRSRSFSSRPLSGRSCCGRPCSWYWSFRPCWAITWAGPPDSPAANADAEVFSQTMNLNAFADLPADSFGAVYGRLLQGDPQ